MKKITIIFAAVCMGLGGVRLVAADYTVSSHVISGGGGTSSAGSYTLTGTIGQPIAGSSSAGETTLQGGFWPATLQVVLPDPGESFAAWMESLPEEDKPPEGQRGALDDPAGDGMSNLLKYALGLMPMVPAADAAPRVVVVAAVDEGIERDYLAIELERSKSAAVHLQLEISQDLVGWYDAPFATEVITSDVGGNRERIQLLSGIPVEERSRYFLRLRVDTL